MVQVHSRWRSLTQTCLVLTHRALTMITRHSRCRLSRHSCLSWMVLEQARVRWSSMKTLPCEVMCYLSSEMWCSLNCSAVVHIFLNQVASSSFTSICIPKTRDDKFGLFSEWKFDLWKLFFFKFGCSWRVGDECMRDITDERGYSLVLGSDWWPTSKLADHSGPIVDFILVWAERVPRG